MQGWARRNYSSSSTSLIFQGTKITTPNLVFKYSSGLIGIDNAPGGWHPGVYGLNFDKNNRLDIPESQVHTKWAAFIPTASAFGSLGSTKSEQADNIHKIWTDFTFFNDVGSSKIRTPFDGIFGMDINEEHVKISKETKTQVVAVWIKPDLTNITIPTRRTGVIINKTISKPVAFVVEEEIEFAGGNNSVIVNSGAKVNVEAGEHIVFSPGFSAKKGANLSAKIAIRSYSTLRKRRPTPLKPIFNNNIITSSSYKDKIKDYSDGDKTNTIRLTTEKSIHSVDITAYPNPVGDELFINITRLSIGNQYSIEISNSTGQVMLAQELNYNNRIPINLVDLPSGVFILKVQTENIVQSFKIVKH